MYLLLITNYFIQWLCIIILLLSLLLHYYCCQNNTAQLDSIYI